MELSCQNTARINGDALGIFSGFRCATSVLRKLQDVGLVVDSTSIAWDPDEEQHVGG